MTPSDLMWHDAEVTAVADIIEPVREALARLDDDLARSWSADLEVAPDILRQDWPAAA